MPSALYFNNLRIPKTKRSIYYKLENFLENYFKSIENNPNCRPEASIGIKGPRHCGKSTVLLQLMQTLVESNYKVFYKQFEEDEELINFRELVMESRCDVVLVDEICKASSITQRKFINIVRDLQIYGIPVVYTGSTAYIIDDLCESIGRGEVWEMEVLTYLEYLVWKHDMEEIWTEPKTAKSLVDKASNDTLKEYISDSKSFFNSNRVEDYVSLCIKDSIISYKNRKYMDYSHITDTEIQTILLYLAIKQVVNTKRLTDIRKYGEIPEKVNKTLQEIQKDFSKISNEKRNDILELLKGSNLLKDKLSFDGEIYNYFIFPWLLTEYLHKSGIDDWFNNIKPLEDVWIESYISNLCCSLFDKCGKYRISLPDAGEREVDILMGNIIMESAIEIKNSHYQSAREKQKSARDLVDRLNIETNLGIEYFYTYSENRSNNLPAECAITNQKLIFILELYKAHRGDRHRTIGEIIAEWNNL